MIQDPGAGLATREERRDARLAVWVEWWRDATPSDKRDIVWDAFKGWYRTMAPSAQFRLFARVRAKMGAPDATFEEMKDWICDSLSTRQLLRAFPFLPPGRGRLHGLVARRAERGRRGRAAAVRLAPPLH